MSCAAGPTLPNIKYNFFILPPPLHLVKKTSKKFHEKPPVILNLNFLKPVKKISGFCDLSFTWTRPKNVEPLFFLIVDNCNY